MAALTAPMRTAAQHQSLLHFVAQGEWSDEAVMERICAYAMPQIERHGAISAWIVDDTAFPKKGRHSRLTTPPVFEVPRARMTMN